MRHAATAISQAKFSIAPGSQFISQARDALIENDRWNERELTQAWRAFFGELLPYQAVPVTLTFDRRIPYEKPNGDVSFSWLTLHDARETVRFFMRNVDRACFGPAAFRRGECLPCLWVFEWGEKQGLHYHGAIERPSRMDEDVFRDCLRHRWQKTHYTKDIHLGESSSKNWLAYMLKQKATGLATDHIDLFNTRRRPA